MSHGCASWLSQTSPFQTLGAKSTSIFNLEPHIRLNRLRYFMLVALKWLINWKYDCDISGICLWCVSDLWGGPPFTWLEGLLLATYPGPAGPIDLWRPLQSRLRGAGSPGQVSMWTNPGVWIMVHNKLWRWWRGKSCVTFWTPHFFRLVWTWFLDCRCR